MAELSVEQLRQLVADAKSGNTEAFGQLYKLCYTPLFRYIYFKLGPIIASKQIAEDLTANVFVKAFTSLDKMKTASGSPMIYFYTIARNIVIDYQRKKKEDHLPEDFSMDDFETEQVSPIDFSILRENKQLLTEALTKISSEQREIITLRFLQELSTEEIIEVTGKSADAVRQLQSRGLRSLRLLLMSDKK
ncbi:MAG: hypothetical protein RL094_685 [Candidatus Parcubacteria bacterium]|jgi:RNA polymerase sigma-70 factor (ECF subfamily)